MNTDYCDNCQSEHSSEEIAECIGCGRSIYPSCKSNLSSACCNNCAAQEML